MNVYWAIPYSHIFQGKNDRKTKYVFFRFSTNWRTIDCVTLEMHKFTIEQEKNLKYFHLWT